MLRLASLSTRQPIRRMGVSAIQQRHFTPARAVFASQQESAHMGATMTPASTSSWGFKILGGALVAGAGYTLLSQSSFKTIYGKDLEAEPAAPATTEAPAAPQEGSEAPKPAATEGGEAKAEEAAAPAPKPKSTKPEPLYMPYVIIGTGTSAFAAANAIKEKNPDAQILLVGDEGEVPYNRTPLSKELWHTDDPKIAENLVYKQWDGKQRSLYYEPPTSFVDAFSEEGQKEIARHRKKASPAPKPTEVPEGEQALDAPEEPLLNRIKITHNKAVSLNVDTQLVTLANGQKVYYEKLLIATGGTPRKLPVMKKFAPEVAQHVTTYRKLSDFKELEALTAGGNKHVAVIGGGFLGSELACSLAHRAKSVPGLKVTQIFPEDGNMGLVFPKYLSEWTTGKLRQEGINVVTKGLVSDIVSREGGGVTLVLKSGETLDVDHVVVAIGINANMDLARKAGLEIDERRGGIVVNAELEARRNIFAAGDASSYHDIALGRRRVEHYEHAVVSGKVAGENMAGARKPYKHQPMFWSDLGPKIGYEAVGIIDSSLVTVGVWAKATAKDTPKEAAAAGNIRSADVGDIKDSSEATKETPAVPEAPEVPEDDDKYGKGIVYYLKNKKVVGVLTWNMFNKMKSAREIIREGKEFSDYSELAQLIKIDKDHH